MNKRLARAPRALTVVQNVNQRKRCNLTVDRRFSISGPNAAPPDPAQRKVAPKSVEERTSRAYAWFDGTLGQRKALVGAMRALVGSRSDRDWDGERASRCGADSGGTVA